MLRIVLDLITSKVPSIRTTNVQVLAITTKSNVKIEELYGEIKTICNVLYMHGVKSNLLSVGTFTNLGYVVLFDST